MLDSCRRTCRATSPLLHRCCMLRSVDMTGGMTAVTPVELGSLDGFGAVRRVPARHRRLPPHEQHAGRRRHQRWISPWALRCAAHVDVFLPMCSAAGTGTGTAGVAAVCAAPVGAHRGADCIDPHTPCERASACRSAAHRSAGWSASMRCLMCNTYVVWYDSSLRCLLSLPVACCVLHVVYCMLSVACWLLHVV